MALASVVPQAARRRTIAITLTQFIHFEASEGNGKVVAVNDIRTQPDWHPATDFYLAFRNRVRRGVAEEDLSSAQLLALADLVDADKRARYVANARGFAAFEKRYRPQLTGRVEPGAWSEGEIRITADPEAIFKIDDRKYITKVYLRKDPLVASRVLASLELLREVYSRPGHRVAVLDCPRGLLHRDTRLNQQSPILLRTTAAQFVGMWRALEQGVRVTDREIS